MNNLTEVKKRLKEIGEILDNNKERREKIDPLIKDAQKELAMYEKEGNFLATQWNMLVQEEKELTAVERNIEEREKQFAEQEMYNKAYSELPHFFVAVREPLSNWINHNERRFMGMVKPNINKILQKMEEDWHNYDKPYVQPNNTMAMMRSIASVYERSARTIKKLEIDQPDNYELLINNENQKLLQNFNTYFSSNAFKGIYV